jgi:NAD(P)-dependent dehydrogenase (short-subunit alcohol dehydrogenase family)
LKTTHAREESGVFQDLKDKRVIVTAAASGIGKAIAEAFDDAGAVVHVCDVDKEGLAALRAERPGIATAEVDVSDVAAMDRFFEGALAALGGLDVLVNNAGISGPVGPVEDMDVEAWRRTMAVNVDGVFFGLRHAVPVMKKAESGSIVNIASTAGLMGYPLRTPYAASKFAMVGITKTLAMELGPFGIRVNAICPGTIDGPRMDGVMAAEAKTRGIEIETLRRSYLRQASLLTFIDAADIAASVCFLCSLAGARITGQAISVDGNNETLRLIE